MAGHGENRVFGNGGFIGETEGMTDRWLVDDPAEDAEGSRRKKVHAKMKRTREERSWADWLMPQRRSRAGRRKGQRKRVGTRRMEGMESQPGRVSGSGLL